MGDFAAYKHRNYTTTKLSRLLISEAFDFCCTDIKARNCCDGGQRNPKIPLLTQQLFPRILEMSAKALFAPLEVGSITLKNRFVMSALTRNRAANTYPTEIMKEYYLQRVQGGVGLIVSEGILITRQG